MRNLYTKLLLLIAGATQKELARQVQYLKIENQILRSKLPARFPVTPQERNAWFGLAARLGKTIHEIVSIVQPQTLLRWIREDRKGRRRVKQVNVGRRPTAESIRKPIVKLARETGRGYTRILGEFKLYDHPGITRFGTAAQLRLYFDMPLPSGRGNAPNRSSADS